jgi:ParB family chromosome partitioning protein
MPQAARSQAELQAAIAEIDERLLTRPPTALDGALLLVDRKSAYEALHPDTTHGGDRKSQRFQEIKTQSIAFCSDTAERLGLKERVVQLKVKLGEDVLALDEGADALRSSPIADNEAALRTFVALAKPHRTSVYGLWSDNPALGLRAALVAARLQEKADSDEMAFQSLLSAFGRASTATRRRFLDGIGNDAKATEAVIKSWLKRERSKK